MSSLVVLQPQPRSKVAVAVLVAIGGAGLAMLGFTTEGSEAVGGFGAILFVFGLLGYMAAKSSAKEAIRSNATWLLAVEEKTAELNALEELPTVDCPLSLQKDEVCHWAGPASWYEYRAVTKRVNYHGLTASIPIAKGIRYRVGSIAPLVQRESELVPIDDGQLYITNKRILYDGRQKNTTLTWKGLIQVQLFQGGFILEKNTGKSPHLMIASGAEDAALIVARHL